MDRLMMLPPPALAGLGLVALVWIFLPTLVAVFRRRHDFLAILGVNVAFCFSFAVWIPLLAWATTGRADQTLVARLKQAGAARWIGWAIMLALLASVTYACVEVARFLAGG